MTVGRTEISPAELVRDVLVRLGWPDVAPGGVVVGPATDAQQQLGVVSIVQAGLPQIEDYSPLQWMRAQVRCLAGTLDAADRISFAVQRELHGRDRTIARMASTDQRYLVHQIRVTAGPSNHYDSQGTWEALLFAELMIGTEPL